MQIVIRSMLATPIYEQIAEQIRAQILDGSLPRGQLLPSIRSLANDLRVSVITTKKAYEVLEQQGFVLMLPQRGTVVNELSAGVLHERALDEMRERARLLIRDAGKSGISREEMQALLRDVTEETT